MATAYSFADEAGDFVFKRKPGASVYFLLCTVTANEWTLSEELLQIRRSLAAAGEPDRDKLHATSDLQEVRNRVFAALAGCDFRIDATILEKSKAREHIRRTEDTFYRYAWYYHFKHVGPILMRRCNSILITAAALGQKKTKAAFKEGVNNTVQQIIERDRWEVAFHESSKDPLLWVADYCAWAIQRKWEKADERSYSLIRPKIQTEFELWKYGTKHFY
ncbi:DUF3800 domain-containing protein [Aurantimonas sp. A2-1-M11]|uniref:DUF3800 domain-containing protein n=1 Tax=Aurantimonas sp. A2-1-M11 TaxID=3113712 RepID=UPI002F94C461